MPEFSVALWPPFFRRFPGICKIRRNCNVWWIDSELPLASGRIRGPSLTARFRSYKERIGVPQLPGAAYDDQLVFA